MGGWVLTNSLVYPNLSWSWVRLRLGCDKMKEVFKANQCHIVKWPTLNILKGFGNHMWKITCQRNAFFSITRGGGSTHDGKFHKKNAFLLKPSLRSPLLYNKTQYSLCIIQYSLWNLFSPTKTLLETGKSWQSPKSKLGFSINTVAYLSICVSVLPKFSYSVIGRRGSVWLSCSGSHWSE